MKILIIAALAALAAQGAPSPTAAQFSTARRLLNERMLDYPSARFRDVRANRLIICGFVNSKNRMGAYTGWMRFAAVIGEEPDLYTDEGGGGQDILLDTFCGEDGHRLTGPDYSERLTHR